MTTRLKIDLAEGVLEVEGSESFVKAIYSDFKAHFIGEEAAETSLAIRKTRKTRKRSKKSKAQPPAQKPAKEDKAKEAKAPVSKPAEAAPAPKPEAEAQPASSKSAYKFLKKLDLSAGDDRPSLVEFMDTKFPITNEERNLVFLYYLEQMLNLKSVTMDHIYTCYRAVKIRAPLDLEASLQSTAEQHRWIKITKSSKLSVTPAGKLYVEKQLPKKIKS